MNADGAFATIYGVNFGSPGDYDVRLRYEADNSLTEPLCTLAWMYDDISGCEIITVRLNLITDFGNYYAGLYMAGTDILTTNELILLITDSDISDDDDDDSQVNQTIHIQNAYLAAAEITMIPDKPPMIYFTDLTHVPGMGGINGNGGFVTVWGDNFGSACCYDVRLRSESDNSLTEPLNILVWKYDDISGREKITFQTGVITDLGKYYVGLYIAGTDIPAAANGYELPLFITDGSIYFVNDAGDDTLGDGSWDNPWKTIPKAIDVMVYGDIVYVGTPDNYESNPSFANMGLLLNVPNPSGSGGNSLANAQSKGNKGIVAFPGAVVYIGGDKAGEASSLTTQYRVSSGAQYTTYSQFIVRPRNGRCYEVFNASNYERIVGNYITCPTGDEGGSVIAGGGTESKVLGNHFDDVGRKYCSKLYHTIYYGSAINPEIAWNRFTDSYANRAVQFNASSGNGVNGALIHDNLFRNQRGNPVNFAGEAGGLGTPSYVFNNIFDHCGIGPLLNGQYCAINLNESASDNCVVYVYNNLIINSGADIDPLVNTGSNGGICADDYPGKAYIYNNIIISNANRFYNAFDCAQCILDEGGVISGNLCFGTKQNIWAFDSKAYLADPQITFRNQPVYGFNYYGDDGRLIKDNTAAFRDYAIAPDSPAVGRAVGEAPAVLCDINGTYIPDGFSDTIGPWYIPGTASVNQSSIHAFTEIFDFVPGAFYHKPVEVILKLNGNYLQSIRSNSYTLTENIDYTIESSRFFGERCILLPAFFEKNISAPSVSLEFVFSAGNSSRLTVELKNQNPGDTKESGNLARPIIAYSDLTSGPASGGPGGNGAIVTLWGENFGDYIPGVSNVTVGGTDAILAIPELSYSGGSVVLTGASNIYWGKDRVNGMDSISFQIPSSLSEGVYYIHVYGRYGVSNALRFDVRAGKICYVASSSDPGDSMTGSGSMSNPYNSISRALSKTGAEPGSITYVVGSFTQTITDQLSVKATSTDCALPIVLAAYPGATVKLLSNYVFTDYYLGVAPEYPNTGSLWDANGKITPTGTYALSPGCSVDFKWGLGAPDGALMTQWSLQRNEGDAYKTPAAVLYFDDDSENITISKIIVGVDQGEVAMGIRAMNNPSNLKIVSCDVFAKAGTDACTVGTNGRWKYVRHGVFYGMADGLKLLGNNFYFTGTPLEGDDVVHIRPDYGSNHDMEIAYNTINNGWQILFFDIGGGDDGNFENVSIHHNFFGALAASRTAVSVGRNDGVTKNITVNNNVFYNQNLPLAVNCDNNTGLIIRDNTFYGGASTAAMITINQKISPVITGNLFFATTANKAYVAFAGGASAPESGDYGNIFANAAAAAVKPVWDTGSPGAMSMQNLSDWFTDADGLDFTRANGSYPAGAFSWSDVSALPYTVSYDLNGGTGSAADNIRYDSGDYAWILDYNGISRAGYTFAGWTAVRGDAGTSVSGRLQINGNVMLYALWTPLVTVTNVRPGNGQANIDFAIRSANGKGYSVMISKNINGPFALADVNFNSSGAHVKGLTNGTAYYAYIVYSSGGIYEESAIVKLIPNK